MCIFTDSITPSEGLGEALFFCNTEGVKLL